MRTSITRRRATRVPILAVTGRARGDGRRSHAGVGPPGHAGRRLTALRRQRRLRVPGARASDRIVLVLGTSLADHAGGDAELHVRHKDQELYQIKIDNTGDAREDLVFQFTFSGKAGKQKVTLRGPVRRTTSARSEHARRRQARSRATSTRCSASRAACKLFAGPRDDPFFIDLEQFFRILPDRKPKRARSPRSRRAR